MLRESIDEMLACFREHSARCEYLKREIPRLEHTAHIMRKNMVEDSISVTAVLSDIPHGSGVSDPVGRLAEKLADGYVTDHVRQIEEEIAKKRAELQHKSITVEFVPIWLEALNSKERFIVEKQVLDKLFWREVAREYEQQFGEMYSKHGLKAIRDAALAKIYRIAE